MRIQMIPAMLPMSMKLPKRTIHKQKALPIDPFNQTVSFKEEKNPWIKKPVQVEETSMFSSMAKAMTEDNKTKRILKKIARGEQLDNEELAHLEKVAPEQIQKAKAAAQRRKEIEKQLEKAKNKDEAESILRMAKQEALAAFQGEYTKEYGEYLMEAVNKAEEKYHKGKPMGDDENATQVGFDMHV